jgi:hypothetical protein
MTTQLTGNRPASAKGLAPRKAARADDCVELEHIPNIGKAIADDLRKLGIHQPQDLARQDGWALYESLCLSTGKYHDPCVLDTFIAATEFMRGGPPLPWWQHTAERKARYGAAVVALKRDLSG